MKITLQSAPEIPKRGPWGILWRDLRGAGHEIEMIEGEHVKYVEAVTYTNSRISANQGRWPLTREEASASAAPLCLSVASRRFPLNEYSTLDCGTVD